MSTLPRQQISILAGASGSGKTTLLLQAIKAHYENMLFPIQFKGDNIAMIVADRSCQDVVARAKELGVNNVEIYGFVDDRTYDLRYLEDANMALSKCLERIKNPFDVLILDPMMLFMRGNNIDYKQVAMSLSALNRLAVDLNVTMVGVHHATKTRSDFKFMRPQDRISGSAAFQGYSGTQLALVQAVECGQPFDELTIISHTEPEQHYCLQRDPDGWFYVLDQQAELLARLGEFGKFFEAKPLATAQELSMFAASAGMQKTKFFKELKKLTDNGLLTKPQRGLYAVPNKEEVNS